MTTNNATAREKAWAVSDVEARAYKRSKMTLLALQRIADWRKLTPTERARAIDSLHVGRQVAADLGLLDEVAAHSAAIRLLETLATEADTGDPK